MSRTAQEVHCKADTATDIISLDLTATLDTAETVTGTPTVSVIGLTLGSAAFNTSAVTINGAEVAIGKAIQFSCSGGTAGQYYTITVTYSTTESRSGLEALLTLQVV
jgi:hypothetical protein